MKHQGSLVVVIIFAVALAAAIFAWNFRMRQSHRVLEFYGGRNASLIRAADTVYWASSVDTDRPTHGDNLTPAVELPAEMVEITEQSGLIHARAALISDVSYRWNEPTSPARWQFAMQFEDTKDKATCTLAFDLESRQCGCLENGKQVVMGDKLVSGLSAFARRVRREDSQDADRKRDVLSENAT